MLDVQVLVEEEHFLIVYKPPRMHSAPLTGSIEKNTILNWSILKFPEIAALPGRKAGEGGLLHRLDYETHGLILIARTPAGLEALLEQQKKGSFFKEYSALTKASEKLLPGFPEREKFKSRESMKIQSAFRAYGPGRKAVRPVPADLSAAGLADQYLTEILEARNFETGLTNFRIRLFRGFRHQIRCHLAWLGMPIINDKLYGGEFFGSAYLDAAFSSETFLCLRACSLSFIDPASAKDRFFSIPPLSIGS